MRATVPAGVASAGNMASPAAPYKAGWRAATGFWSRRHRQRWLLGVPGGWVGPRAVHLLVLQGGIESPLLRRQQPGPPDPGPLMAPALLPVVAPQQLLAVGRWWVGGVAVRWAAGKC